MTAEMTHDGAVAIVAMAGRFPSAPSVEALWDLVLEGRSALTSRSEVDLRAAGVSDELLSRPDYVRKTMLLDDIALFAARFFGYSERQAAELDPQQRLFLEYAWIAAEQAGFNPDASPRVTGVFASVSANSYALERLCQARRKPGSSDHFQAMLDSDKDFLATRVAYKLDLRGPAVTVQTACSSSLVAVHLACQSLLAYECDEALAGGVSLQIPHGTGYLFVDGGIAARDGVCRPFDDLATGTIQGSGVGVVALKRVEDALADGDRVLALIRGSAINNDGARKVGFTAPSVVGQIAVIRRAMAGVPPASIQLIEAHGTGTLQGDAIELAALSEIYRQSGVASRSCAIGSIKGHIGHLDVAAGVTGLIKAVLCLRHRTLPPSAPVSNPNNGLRGADCPFFLNEHSCAWPEGPSPRRAAVSSFGMGGTNAHLILEEAPAEAVAPLLHVEAELLTLSAKNPEELRDAAQQLADYLRHPDAAPLRDVAHTLRFGRRRFAYRRFLVAKDTAQAIAHLSENGRDDAAADERTRSAALLIGDPVAERAAPVRGPLGDALYARLVADCLVAWPDKEEAKRLESWLLLGGADGAVTGLDPVLHAIGQYCAGAWVAAQGVEFSAYLTSGRGLWIAAALSKQLGLADALLYSTGRASGQDAAAHAVLVRSKSKPIFTDDALPSGPLASRPWRGARAELPVWIDVSAPRGETAGLMRALGNVPEKLLPLTPEGGGSRANWLECIGLLWRLGVPFQRQSTAGGPRLIPLPSYPWRRDVCWLPPEMPQAAAVKVQSTTSQLEILRPGWAAAAPWPQVTATEVPTGGAAERLILFGAEHPLAAAIIALVSKDTAVMQVRTGHQFERSSCTEYVVDPGCPDDVVALLCRLAAEGWQGGRAINLWPLTSADPSSVQLHLAQAAALQGGMWRAMLSVTGSLFSDALEPEPSAAAALPGLLKVIAQELATPHGLADFTSASLADAAGRNRVATAVLAELRGLRGAPVAVYRGRTRYVREYHRWRWAETDASLVSLKLGGRYLITGGFGVLGLALAEYLGSQYQARLGLLSRTALPERGAWKGLLSAKDARHDEHRRLVQRIMVIEAQGGQVLPLSADVTDHSALEAAVGRGDNLWGGWDGVFHLAVNGRDGSIRKPISALSPSDLDAQARPKLDGLRALDSLFRTRPVNFKLAFSSIAAQLGGFGLGAYAACNASLDHEAQDWITINWDGWSLSALPGTPYCIDTAAGLAALETVLGHIGEGAVVVAAGDFHRRAETWLAFTDKAEQDLPPLGKEESLEALLRRIWNHILGLHDNDGNAQFADLGGDSLIAMRLIEAISDEINVSVPIEKFISGSITIKKLQDYIVEHVKSLHDTKYLKQAM